MLICNSKYIFINENKTVSHKENTIGEGKLNTNCDEYFRNYQTLIT